MVFVIMVVTLVVMTGMVIATEALQAGNIVQLCLESFQVNGIAIGVAAGGRLDDINLDSAFWTPVSVMTRPDGSTR